MDKIPSLKELFTPCPICGGTINMDSDGIVYCESCKQSWNIFGEPLEDDKWIDIVGWR
jgi:uncharacterized Zn finger protein (UPF0148 family)